MGFLRRLETMLERGVEDSFARIFRSRLEPVELGNALKRYAGDFQQVGVDGVFVPNVYRYRVSPDDHARFAGYADSLADQLARTLRDHVQARGWHLQGPIRIEIAADEAIGVGRFELAGKTESPRRAAPTPQPAAREVTPPRPTPPPADDAAGEETPAPSSMETPTTRAPEPGDPGLSERTAVIRPAARAHLDVLSGPRTGHRYTVDGEGGVLGRLADCAVQLDDPSVSRRHARLMCGTNGWAVEDLGSTNGVKVNGAAVGRSPLQHGDTLQLGTVRLSFAVSEQ